MPDLINTIISLAKRRGFVFPGSEIYGGLANSWDYGPLGVELKNNIKRLWWQRFVHERDDIVGLDAALIMNPKVWEASGHLQGFSDLLVECRKCNNRIRVDQHLDAIDNEEFASRFNAIDKQPEDFPGHHDRLATEILHDIGRRLNMKVACPECSSHDWTEAKPFNLMMQVVVGTTRNDAALAYLRPETAQGMFVNFKNILDTTRKRLPFGIAQIGKAFRNEITPGNFIFRTREFEQMEIEYFIPRPKTEADWTEPFERWKEDMLLWVRDIGIAMDKVRAVEIPDGERAHYSKRTIDIEFEFPFGQKELYGLAYRTDFDLKNHEEHSGENLTYKDPDTGEEFWPHVIEPTWGVDRSVLAVLLSAYAKDGERVVLKLKPELAPYKVAVFPLLANKPQLVEYAGRIAADLRKHFTVAFDDRGNIGKRYYSQDEIGTPLAVTVDFQTLEDHTVTLRDRDTAQQKRHNVSTLKDDIRRALAMG
ncbi:MAG: glycine--tRNA ligase [bacterium]|nr:glycine--tRNA ligase [bacterium]